MVLIPVMREIEALLPVMREIVPVMREINTGHERNRMALLPVMREIEWHYYRS